jgi:hypothetical protein
MLIWRAISLRLLGYVLLACSILGAQSVPAQVPLPSSLDLTLPNTVYVRVQLDKAVQVAKLRPGDVVSGQLAQGVYAGDREMLPAKSGIRLTVDSLGRRRRVPNDHWPWVIQAFTPRHESYPRFQSAVIIPPDAAPVSLHVSLISISREREVQARENGSPSRTRANNNSPAVLATAAARKSSGAVITLEAENPAARLERPVDKADKDSAERTLAAGTKAKVVLLDGVSASRSRPGDSFQARLVEPVWLNSKVVLPEGTILEGKVVSRTPPRMLSRAGSLMLTFTDLTLPGEKSVPVAASLTSAELDARSHTKIDAEGRLRGDRPGAAWMAINLGVTAGIAKEADDTIQLIIEAVVDSATDASTAGTGRIVAMCASGLFLLTRHGRDVDLPRFTEVNVVFDRPVSLAVR